MPPDTPPDQRASAAPAIELADLTLGYERHPAVHHLSLCIAPGSLVALVGPNGAGKSTLIQALAGQLAPLSGRLGGLAGQRIAWLPQHGALDRSFPITVRDMVLHGLWHRIGALGRVGGAEQRLCDRALADVGLTGFERRTIDTLSGGQLQRALFARLILQDAPVVLLDEPFAAVDSRTTQDLLALLHQWHAAGKTVIVVLHDLAQVRAHFPLTLLLAREPVAWGATAEVLTEAHWASAQRMREPFDDAAPPCERPHADASATAHTLAHLMTHPMAHPAAARAAGPANVPAARPAAALAAGPASAPASAPLAHPQGAGL